MGKGDIILCEGGICSLTTAQGQIIVGVGVLFLHACMRACVVLNTTH